MFTAYAGQARWEKLENGGFKRLEDARFTIREFGESAKDTFERYLPGDNFIAQGDIHEYPWTNPETGQTETRREFIIRSIGHDSKLTNYDVVRKSPEQAVEQAGPAQDMQQAPIAQQAPVQQVPMPQAQMQQQVPMQQVPDQQVSYQSPPGMEPSQAQPVHRLPNVNGSGMTREPEPAGASMQHQM